MKQNKNKTNKMLSLALKSNNSNLAYKVITKTNWNNFIKLNVSKCYGFDNDIKDGFIHLSTIEQLDRTLDKLVPEDKFGLKEYKNFNILCIDLDNSKGVRWECKYKCTHKCRSTTELVSARIPIPICNKAKIPIPKPELCSETGNILTTNVNFFCERWPHIYGYISPNENILFAMDLALYKKKDINQDL